MSNEAAAGDIRTIAGARDSAVCLAVSTACLSDSAMTKRLSWYFSASAWPDSPIRIICLMSGDCKIS